VTQTLQLLDTRFKTFAQGIADGRYAFWLGSGISRGRFPMLEELIVKVLEYLRVRITVDDPNCSYREALARALDNAALSAEERDQIDFAQPVKKWLEIKRITRTLSTNYSTFLNIRVGDEVNDILVWEGVDVAGTYGDDTVEPDAEHLCLAMMVREGIVDELASANWDGLVEKATAAISNGNTSLVVCVKSEDLQNAQQKPKLLKFHGCAVRARNNENEYRPYIVGREAQLASWSHEDKTKGIFSHLVTVISERPTLMLGLSAQDFNIQHLFGKAEDTLAWQWPGERPSYVFSEEEVTDGQQSLLEIVYKGDYQGAKRTEIKGQSHIRAFAKPLLLALLFFSIAEKLGRLSKLADVSQDGMTEWIDNGLIALRNDLATKGSCDHLAFASDLVEYVSRTRTLVTSGNDNGGSAVYQPITSRPASAIEADIDMQANGLPEAAIAAAAIGNGIEQGLWTLEAPGNVIDRAGIAVVKSGKRETRLFVAASTHAASMLFATGRVELEDDAVLIHSKPIHYTQQRAPLKAPGRTGRLQIREVCVETLLEKNATPAAFLEQFKQETAL